jgi:CDGSH-type Zn-finger protein
MTIRPDGAVWVSGDLEVWPANATEPIRLAEALLCRCGRSSDKPFCDKAHDSCAFDDPGSFTNGHLEASSPKPVERRLVIRAVEDGPLLVEGSPVIIDANGEERHSPGRVMICRCGASNSKPFCDGRHGWVAFTDPEPAHED